MIDIQRCLNGLTSVYVHGAVAGGHRLALIEEAIAAIHKDPASALATEFLGFKNYAHFGDQRCDCPYGMGPRHGSIVFSIARRDRNAPVNGDAIYLLECVRDFGAVGVTVEGGDGDANGKRTFNLCDVLERWRQLTAKVEQMDALLKEATVVEEAAAASTDPRP
jgi:hypothetical protein